MTNGSAMIQGVGPGLGAALVRRFRRDGLKVAAVARNRDRLQEAFKDDPGVTCFGADATDGAAMTDVVARIEDEIGPLEVAVANSAAWKIAPFLEFAQSDFEEIWRQGCLPAFHVAQAAARPMIARGRGTILFTGSAGQLRAGPGFSAMAVAKHGLRGMAHALAREMGPKGVHVAHIVVDGPIDSARTRAAYSDHDKLIDPAGIADLYAMLHAQPRHAWSNEIDLRTFADWPT